MDSAVLRLQIQGAAVGIHRAVHPAQAVQQLGVNRLHFGAHRRRLQRPIHQLLALGKSALAHVAERKPCHGGSVPTIRSEEHTSELQSLMRISYAVFCLKKKKKKHRQTKSTN